MIKLGEIPVKSPAPRLGYISTEMKKSYSVQFPGYVNVYTLVNKHIDMCRNDNVKMQDSHIFAPEPEAWRIATESYLYERENLWIGCKPISLPEAISRAQKNTVAGFILQTIYGYETKGDFYNDLPRLTGLIVKIEAGEDVPVIWKISDKTEIRPNEKINHLDPTKRKQRTMMASDALHYIVGLMLFAEQNDAIVDEAEKSWSAAGVSLFHRGWDKMARYLIKPSGRKTLVRCKDVSAMESCVRYDFQKVIYRARRSSYVLSNGEPKYTDRNWLALFDWWVKHVTCSVVIDMDGSVWMQIGQNPSGCLNTLYDNIDTNILLYRYHLAKPMKFSHAEVPEFNQYCYSFPVKFMGDDSIFADHPVFEGLDQSASELGVVLTDESDGAVPLEKAMFCGFGFLYHSRNDSWLPRPNVEKLVDSLLMHKKNNSARFEFAKLCAFKVLFYPLADANYRWVCEQIIHYKKRKMLDMQSEVRFDDALPMHSLLSQELSETQIARLYLNLETFQGTLESVSSSGTILNDL